jgi:hypothetical protein
VIANAEVSVTPQHWPLVSSVVSGQWLGRTAGGQPKHTTFCNNPQVGLSSMSISVLLISFMMQFLLTVTADTHAHMFLAQDSQHPVGIGSSLSAHP